VHRCDVDHAQALKGLHLKCPSLKSLIYRDDDESQYHAHSASRSQFNSSSSHSFSSSSSSSSSLMISLDTVVEAGKLVEKEELNIPHESQLAMIMYTRGTSG
jgi:hypothetical protein